MARNAVRRYEVVRKVLESLEITSFHLRPKDGAGVTPFRPGQHLTLELPAGCGTPISRTYSISCGPYVTDHYRISVKRERAPVGARNVPDGLGSGFLHDQVDVGHELIIQEPKGSFVLDTQSRRPVLLLSGGVGITPLLSMLYALATHGDRDVWFIHACRDGGAHAFSSEVRALADSCSRIRVHFCYETPLGDDVLGAHFDSIGRVDRATLQPLLPLKDYDVYMCGSPGFMQAMFDLMVRLGVEEDRIAYEFFGAGRRLRPSEQAAGPHIPALGSRPSRLVSSAASRAVETDAAYGVSFACSGIDAQWEDRYGNLLEFAEAKGLTPDFSCRAGICNSCECGLRSGKVKYVADALDPPAPGRVLICCTVPASDITLEL